MEPLKGLCFEKICEMLLHIIVLTEEAETPNIITINYTTIQVNDITDNAVIPYLGYALAVIPFICSLLQLSLNMYSRCHSNLFSKNLCIKAL